MLSFTDCCRTLGTKDQKKIANNTYLVRIDADTFGVRLHNTVVVRVHRNRTYTLNAEGYRTRTTKDRINKYSSARLWQTDHQWYVVNGVPFFDGVIVNEVGEPVNAPAAKPAPLFKS